MEGEIREAEVTGYEKRVEDGKQLAYTAVDLDGGCEAQHVGSPGEDCPPIPGDIAVTAEAVDGTKQAIAYYAPKEEPKAAMGEKRFVCRTDTGELVATFWMARGSWNLEIHRSDVPFAIKSPGTVNVDSPDVNLGPGVGRPVACVGDIVIGGVRALSGAPGSPIIPVPPAIPTATGAVPLAGQIVSGRIAVKAAG